MKIIYLKTTIIIKKGDLQLKDIASKKYIFFSLATFESERSEPLTSQLKVDVN